MDWIGVGLAGLACGLAGLLASLVVRNPKDKRVVYFVVFAVFCVPLLVLSNKFVLPNVNVWYQSRNADSVLIKIPVFQTIKQYDPKTYDSLLADVKDSIRMKKSVDESELVGIVRSYRDQIIEKRLPRASGEAVVSYMNVMLTEMNELNIQGGDLCYRFLFPQQSVPVDPQKYISKETLKADLSAFAQVIRTSAENPQPIPQEADVMTRLEPIYVDLAEKYGSDINMLDNPMAPDVDKGKVCVMIFDLYTRILHLPKDESGKILRFMLSQS